MKIDNVNIRVIRNGSHDEVFFTCADPYLNFSFHLLDPHSGQLESGSYTLTMTPVAEAPAKAAPVQASVKEGK